MGVYYSPMQGCTIGIDQSPTHTAVVVLEKDGTLRLAALYGGDQKLKGPARLASIRAWLNKVLEGTFADIGVWETYALKAKNRKFDQGEIGCLAQLALYDHAARVEGCAPIALKKFVAANTAADKDDMKFMVKRRWGVHFDDDNLADAYGLAQLGRVILAPSLTQRRDQREVAARIKKGKAKRTTPYRMSRNVV